jgi:hypothetical protein
LAAQRSIQRRLHRATADRVSQSEAVPCGIGGASSREQLHIGFHHHLDSPFAGDDVSGIVEVDATRSRYQDRNRGPELAPCVGISSRARETDREHSPRERRFQMLLAEKRRLLQQ